MFNYWCVIIFQNENSLSVFKICHGSKPSSECLSFQIQIYIMWFFSIVIYFVYFGNTVMIPNFPTDRSGQTV